MARVQRKVPAKVEDLAAAHNDLKDFVVAQLRLLIADVATIAADEALELSPTSAALGFHNDRSERAIVSANASDLPTSLVLVNEIKSVFSFHLADTMAHKVVDSANALEEPSATDLDTAVDLANEIKASYNTHRASTTYHYTADSTNSISADDADDLESLETLLNELKSDINAHMASGPVCKSTRIVSA